MGLLDSVGNKAAQSIAGVVPEVTGAVDRLGKTAEGLAAGVEKALADAVYKGGIDIALIANAALLEMQAWRLEVAAWRTMVEPIITRGVSITPNQEKQP